MHTYYNPQLATLDLTLAHLHVFINLTTLIQGIIVNVLEKDMVPGTVVFFAMLFSVKLYKALAHKQLIANFRMEFDPTASADVTDKRIKLLYASFKYEKAFVVFSGKNEALN